VELMKSISFVKSIEEDKIADIPEEHKSVVRESIKKNMEVAGRNIWNGMKLKKNSNQLNPEKWTDRNKS